MSKSPYRRLTWKKRSLTGYSQAWLGSDHLLIVNSSNYTERYQRFFFNDIEAIVVTEMSSTIHRALLGLFLAAALALYFRAIAPFGLGFWSVTIPTLAAIAPLGVDLLRGPRCRCVIQTAVNRERLKAVERLRVARKLISALKPSIEAAQGTVTPEEMVQALSAPGEMRFPAPSLATPPLPGTRSYFLEVLFGVLLLDSLLAWLAFRAEVTAAFGAFLLVFSAELLLGTVALFRSPSRASISYILVVLTVLISLIDLFALSGPATWHGFVSFFQQSGQLRFATLAERGNPRTMWLAVGWRLGVGALGLAACYFERREDDDVREPA